MSLESKVLQVLGGPTVARIRFRFPIAGSHVTITSQTFHLVARAIRSGAVIVRRPTDLDPTAGAQYNDVARTRKDGTAVRANTLELNSVSGRFDEATVVQSACMRPTTCCAPGSMQTRKKLPPWSAPRFAAA
jgi:hypothetical protein